MSVIGANQQLPVDALSSFTGSISSSGTLIGPIDTSGYNSISVQLTGIWQGAVIFQASNDNTNWINVQGYAYNTGMSATDTAISNDIYLLPVIGKYFRSITQTSTKNTWDANLGIDAQATVGFSGTVTAVAYLRQQSLAGLGEASLTQAMDDSTGATLKTAFPGFVGSGQQAAVNSMPVAMANEQVLDKFFYGKAYTQTSTFLNFNMLLPPEQVAIDPAAPLDCLQYRSIYFQFNTGGTVSGSNGTNASFLPEASNDLVNWVNVAVFNLQGGTVVGINETRSLNPVNYGTNAIFGANLMMRYFRVRCNSFSTAGAFCQFTTIMRMTPLTYQVETLTNITQVNGSGLGSASTMKNASFIGDSQSPIIMGGLDRSITRSELIGAAGAGGIAQSYLTNGPYTRNAYTDLAGGMGVAGPQPFLAEDKTYPVNVRLERSTNGQDSVQDLLQQLLIELRALNYYTREAPSTIAQLLQTGSTISGLTSMNDDPESIAGESVYGSQKGH